MKLVIFKRLKYSLTFRDYFTEEYRLGNYFLQGFLDNLSNPNYINLLIYDGIILSKSKRYWFKVPILDISYNFCITIDIAKYLVVLPDYY